MKKKKTHIIIFLSIVPSCSVQEVWLVFSNVFVNILLLYNYIYCLRSMPWFTFLFVCVIPFYISVSQAKKKKKKLTIDFFSLYSLFSQIREFALWHFINYAYICTWIHVHGRQKETVLWSAITWSKLRKTYRTYKLKRSIPTCYH